MVPLVDLIWPILLAAVAVLLSSSLLAVLLPRRVAQVHEGALAGIQELPGSQGAVASARTVAARWEGRVAYHLAVNIIVAYLAGLALLPGTDFGTVLRFAASAAFLGYGSASLHAWLAERRSWRAIWKPACWSLVSGIVAGCIFAALWPTA